MIGTYVTVLKRAVKGFGEDNCTSFAAAVSYYALFSLFPLIVFLLSFAGYFIHGAKQRQDLVNGIFSHLGQSVDKNTLYTQVNSFAGGRGGLSIIGLVLAAWSASAVFGAVRTGLNVVWNSTKGRPMVQTKLLDLGMVFGVGLLLILSVAATGVLTAVQGFSNQIFGSSLGILPHILFALLFLIVPPAIAFLAFALTYYLVPHAEIRFKDTWVGAAVAAVAFAIAQYGVAFYFARFAHYDKVYGSIGAVIAFLFFVYVSANILLFGGEVTKEYIDMLAGVEPAEEPQKPTAPRSVAKKAKGFVKGLFVDDSPHHDTSLPYEPGREQPARASAPMAKDSNAKSDVTGGPGDLGKAPKRPAPATQQAAGKKAAPEPQPPASETRPAREQAQHDGERPAPDGDDVRLVRDDSPDGGVKLVKGANGNGNGRR